MGQVRAYRSCVKISQMALLLLAGVTTTAAQTNTALPEVAPPIRYDRYIQLHQVPVDIRSPAQVQREEERRQEYRRDERLDPTLPTPDVMTPPPPRLPPRPATKRGAADSPWPDEHKQDDADREKDKGGQANWGWLADDVRKAEERRSETQADETDAHPEEDATAGNTNHTTRVERDWSDRRETAAAGAPLIRPGVEPRTGRPFAAGDRQPGVRERDGQPYAGAAQPADSPSPAAQAAAAEAARPPDWMLASAALVPDTPIGRSILGSGASPEASAIRDPRASWSGLAQPVASPAGSGSLPGGAGGLRPLEPTLSAPARLAPALETATPFSPSADGRAGFSFTPSQPATFAPALPLGTPAAPSRPSLGNELGTPGIQTRTLPW